MACLTTGSAHPGQSSSLLSRNWSGLRLVDFTVPQEGSPAYLRFLSDPGVTHNKTIEHKDDVDSIGDASTEDEASNSAAAQNWADSGDEVNEANTNTIENPGAERDDGQITTLMIKNIPCRCRRDEVLDAVDELGFAGMYDFFYLPIRRSQHQNYGYAFISLKDPALIPTFRQRFQGFVFKSRKSTKEVSVLPARIQGYESNFKHFSKTNVLESKWAPIFKSSTDVLCAGTTCSSTAGDAHDQGLTMPLFDAMFSDTLANLCKMFPFEDETIGHIQTYRL